MSREGHLKNVDIRCKKCIRALLLYLACILVFIGLLTFRDLDITVDPTDGSVIAIESRWWGIVKNEREIRWMKTADYSSPGWMAKDQSGRWCLYITEMD